MDQNIKPEVTILMPVFNSEKHVELAIRSILNQTYRSFEFLIINDGSTDSTEKIIKSFNDPRIRIERNDKNMGLVYTLNKGIDLAKGEFIARMDADDWSYPFRLQRQVEFMLKNPDVGVCGSDVEVWDGLHINEIWNYPTYDEEIQSRLFFKCSLAHPSVMIRKKVLTTGKFYYSKAFFPAEDYELWTRISKVTKLYNFKTPLLKYRKSENQISSIRNQEQESKTFEIAWTQVLNLDIDKCDKYKPVHKKFLSHSWPKDIDELKTLIEWLELLSISNDKSNIYSKKYFSGELAYQLWRICYFLTNKDFDYTKTFRESILSKYYIPSSIENIKIFLKKFNFNQ